MSYVPLDWVDGTTPVNAANLEHMEQGIDQAHDRLDALETETDIPQPVVNGQWLKGTGGSVVWSGITAADVAFTAAGDIGQTNVQLALAEVAAEKEAVSAKGVANGYAGLGSDGKVPAAQLPAIPAGYVLPARLSDYALTVTDWNDARSNGWYMASGAANGFHGGWILCHVSAHNAIWVTQRAWDFTAGTNSTVYQRRCLNGGWGGWEAEIMVLSQGTYNAIPKTASTVYVIVG